MNSIKLFLSKFRYLTFSNQLIKKEFTLVIKEILNIEIKKENISVKNNIIYINTYSVIKSVVFIKKESLLKELSVRISQYNKNIIDIR